MSFAFSRNLTPSYSSAIGADPAHLLLIAGSFILFWTLKKSL